MRQLEIFEVGTRPMYYTTLSNPSEPVWRVRLWYSNRLAILDNDTGIVKRLLDE